MGRDKVGNPDKAVKNEKFMNFLNLYDRAFAAIKKSERRQGPGELKIAAKLKCRMLIQMAQVAATEIPEEVMSDDELLSLAQTRLENLEEAQRELHLVFHEKALQYGNTKEALESEDEEDSNQADHEHENGKVSAFMKTYKKARQAYFRTVFNLEPGHDMSQDDMERLSIAFTEAEDLYYGIPVAIREELRTQATAGQAFKELQVYIECLKEFFTQFLENEIDDQGPPN